MAGAGQGDGLFNPVGDGTRVGWFGTARRDGRGQGAVQHGNGASKDSRGIGQGQDRFDGLALGSHQGGVADDGEDRTVGPECGPGSRNDLRTHASRFAHGQGQRRRHGGHHFISIRASSRRSRI